MIGIISMTLAAIIVVGPIVLLAWMLVRWIRCSGHTKNALIILALGPTLALGYFTVRAFTFSRRVAT